MASYLYRTAQPLILAAFLPWGGSAGAGRIRLAGAKVHSFVEFQKLNKNFLKKGWNGAIIARRFRRIAQDQLYPTSENGSH